MLKDSDSICGDVTHDLIQTLSYRLDFPCLKQLQKNNKNIVWLQLKIDHIFSHKNEPWKYDMLAADQCFKYWIQIDTFNIYYIS